MAHHLIHIGYPKAGSSFLRAWFEQHPEICYSRGGLGGFADVYAMSRPSTKAYAWYVTSCEGLSMPNERFGEPRVDVVRRRAKPRERIKDAQAQVCGRLRGLFPGSRILIVTRGIEGLIRSGHSQYVRSGGVGSLEEMCGEYSARLGSDALHYTDFDYLIGLYEDAFGAENVMTLPYELLRDDQEEFLAALERQLGLRHVEVQLGRINASLSPDELYWYPLISRTVAGALSLLGAVPSERLARWYVRLTLHNRLRVLITLLGWVTGKRKVAEAGVAADILQRCAGKATRLEGHPLYAAYAADYLWDMPRHAQAPGAGTAIGSEPAGACTAAHP